MATLNERIKEMRNKRGYTLAYVAELLGIKEATMQRYESGEIKNIKHETIVALAKILNCSPSYLMGWEENVGCVDELNGEEKDIISSYRNFPIDLKKRLLTYMKVLKQIGNMESESSLLNAAHAIPNATAEDIQHDEDIMDDDDF